METPQIHQFFDEGDHPAEYLNELALAVLDLVAEVNDLTGKLSTLRAEFEAATEVVEETKSPAGASKAAGRPAATK